MEWHKQAKQRNQQFWVRWNRRKSVDSIQCGFWKSSAMGKVRRSHEAARKIGNPRPPIAECKWRTAVQDYETPASCLIPPEIIILMYFLFLWSRNLWGFRVQSRNFKLFASHPLWGRFQVFFELSPPQKFKHSLFKSAVRSVPQAQSLMDRSGGEPLPDVCRFLVHPCRFLVHRWICRLWLNLTAWNSQKPIVNYVATVCIFFFWSLISYFLRNEAKCFTLKAPLKPVVIVVHVVFFSWNNNDIYGGRFGVSLFIFIVNMSLNKTIFQSIYITFRLLLLFPIVN